MGWRTVLRALVISFAFCPSVAFAHGEAAWIQRSHPQCCGERDCERAPYGAVKRTGSGYYVYPTGQSFPESETKFSEDGDYWWCRFMSGSNAGQVRCLFVPPVGY